MDRRFSCDANLSLVLFVSPLWIDFLLYSDCIFLESNPCSGWKEISSTFWKMVSATLFCSDSSRLSFYSLVMLWPFHIVFHSFNFLSDLICHWHLFASFFNFNLLSYISPPHPFSSLPFNTLPCFLYHLHFVYWKIIVYISMSTNLFFLHNIFLIKLIYTT